LVRPATRGNGALRPVAWIALLFVLSACSGSDYIAGQEREHQANTTVPGDYRADIVAFMRTYLNDPSNVRGVYVTVPALRTIDGASRYASCVRYSAKNSSGQYAPAKDSIVLFRAGRLDRVIDNARDQCRDAPFEPFPEMERMTR